MRTVPARVAVVALLTVGAAGCTGPGAGPRPAPSSSATGTATGGGSTAAPSARPGAPVWRTPLHGTQIPSATRTGFALPTFSAARTFEVTSVDSRTGKVRWHAAASPSNVFGGISQQVLISPDRSLVVWTRPGRVPATGDVSVVAARESDGKPVWTWGGGGVRLNVPPTSCRAGKAVCLVTDRDGVSVSVALETATGRLLTSHRLGPQERGFELATGLRSVGRDLVGVDEQGRATWSRPARDVFGGQSVATSGGWDITSADGRFFGSMGYQTPEQGRLRKGERRTYDLSNLGVTAGFDLRTGRTLWVRPRASVQCPWFDGLDPKHPALCILTGTTVSEYGKKPRWEHVDVTFEGFDPATGRRTWSWHPGAVPEIFTARHVFRVDDSRYLVRTRAGTFLLDLDRGATPAPGLSTGWCDGSGYVRPGPRAAVRAYRLDYRTDARFPCDAAGRLVASPGSTPDFAGATSGGTFAWLDRSAALVAVRVPAGRS